jgi:hypothetical protein
MWLVIRFHLLYAATKVRLTSIQRTRISWIFDEFADAMQFNLLYYVDISSQY